MVLNSFYVAINQTEGKVGLAPLSAIVFRNLILYNRILPMLIVY